MAISGHTTLGAACSVHPFVTLGEPPQDIKYKGEPTRLEIGDNTLIREHATIHRGTPQGGGVTRIGSNCFIMVSTHIAHDCVIGDRVVLINQALLAGHCEVGDHTVIGANVVIAQFSRIGKHAYIAATSGVGSDVIPYGVVRGFRQTNNLYGLNLIGLKQRGFARDDIKTLREAYRQIFDGPTYEIADRAKQVGETYALMRTGRRPRVVHSGASGPQSLPTQSFTRQGNGGNILDRASAMTGADPIAIIAGGGQLPLAVAEAARRAGRKVLVIGLSGFANADFSGFQVRHFRIGQATAIFNTLRREGCADVVLIGAVRRPNRWFRDVGLSFAWLLLRNLNLLWSGDATVLSRLVRMIENEGFVVRGAHEVAPHLVLPAGDHTLATADARDLRDIEVGVRAAREIGALDIGQCVAVSQGRVLAVEAAEGTDSMLERVAILNQRNNGARAGVLVKWPQPIQDLRVDMPTIGPQTVRGAAAAGLAGIAVAGGRVLAVEIETMISLANENGLFLTGLDDRTYGGEE